MKTLKYSRQRESIKEFLTGRKDHPTADMVYMNMRKSYPNISLGTVYRNLALLESLGEVQKISCGDGAERFDPNTEPHYHFVCKKCRCMQDIPMLLFEELESRASEVFEGSIESHTAMFYGICSRCRTVGEKPLDKQSAI